MDRIRVLHLTSTRYGLGGVERLLINIAEEAPTEIELHFCNIFGEPSERGGMFSSSLRRFCRNVHEFPATGLLALPVTLLKVIRLLARTQPDIVHLHMLHASLLGSIAASLSSCKVVVTRHYTPGPAHLGKSGLFRKLLLWLDDQATRRADAVVAVSEFVSNDLHSRISQKLPIEVIYNGIQTAHFRDFPRSDAVRPHSIVSIASLTALKGQTVLLDALRLTQRRYPNVSLEIVGDGPDLPLLKRQCAGLGLDNAVRFSGFTDDIRPKLAAASVVVMPSLYESFGLVAVEAMAMGKCVVASRVGGLPEIIQNGITGILVAPGDVQHLADTLEAALADPESLERIGSAAATMAEKCFDIAQTLRKHERLYNRLVLPRTAGPA